MANKVLDRSLDEQSKMRLILFIVTAITNDGVVTNLWQQGKVNLSLGEQMCLG